MLTLKSLLDMLHEPNTWLFELIWEEFKSGELQDVLDETVKIVRAGGEKTWDCSRFRSDGGIFLRVLREMHRERMVPILKKQQAQRRARQQEKVQAAAQSVKEEVFCPPPVLGQLIGKGGSSIAAIRQKTDCKIVVEADGRVHVEGPLEKKAVAQQLVRTRIFEVIQKTHAPYAEQVSLSELMLKDRDELTAPWQQALYAWVNEAVEHTPEVDMRRVLACMIPATPPAIRGEVKERLSASPMMLGGPSPAVTAVLEAIANADKAEQASHEKVEVGVEATLDAALDATLDGPESLVADMEATQIECA